MIINWQSEGISEEQKAEIVQSALTQVESVGYVKSENIATVNNQSLIGTKNITVSNETSVQGMIKYVVNNGEPVNIDTSKAWSSDGSVTVSSNTVNGNSGTIIFTGLPDLVPQQAFNGCENLVSINIPSNILTIGLQAFNGCTALTTVTIEEGVTNIGNNTFTSCTSLTGLTIPNSVTNESMELNFYECGDALKQVTIGSGVQSLGFAVFGYTSLETLTLLNPDFTKNYGALERVTALPKKIYVPSGSKATYIDSSADGNWAAYADIIEELG